MPRFGSCRVVTCTPSPSLQACLCVWPSGLVWMAWQAFMAWPQLPLWPQLRGLPPSSPSPNSYTQDLQVPQCPAVSCKGCALCQDALTVVHFTFGPIPLLVPLPALGVHSGFMVVMEPVCAQSHCFKSLTLTQTLTIHPPQPPMEAVLTHCGFGNLSGLTSPSHLVDALSALRESNTHPGHLPSPCLASVLICFQDSFSFAQWNAYHSRTKIDPSQSIIQ